MYNRNINFKSSMSTYRYIYIYCIMIYYSLLHTLTHAHTQLISFLC